MAEISGISAKIHSFISFFQSSPYWWRRGFLRQTEDSRGIGSKPREICRQHCSRLFLSVVIEGFGTWISIEPSSSLCVCSAGTGDFTGARAWARALSAPRRTSPKRWRMHVRCWSPHDFRNGSAVLIRKSASERDWPNII